MSELAVEALREAGRLADENRALRSRLAEAERENLRIHNEKVDHFEARIAAEAELANAREAMESIGGAQMLVGADWEGFATVLQNIARAALRSMKEQDDG